MAVRAGNLNYIFVTIMSTGGMCQTCVFKLTLSAFSPSPTSSTILFNPGCAITCFHVFSSHMPDLVGGGGLKSPTLNSLLYGASTANEIVNSFAMTPNFVNQGAIDSSSINSG